MEPDRHGELGFVAAAFVQTRGLRPEFLPSWCGQDFFLSGYRVFVKHRTREGRTLRGLRILRSDANRRGMVCGGNCLTHYNYHHCRASLHETGGTLSIRVDTAGGEADASITAILSAESAPLPSGSPFDDARAARRFAGPLPYTFDYEHQTKSIIRIKGTREEWEPKSVRVEVRRLAFLEDGALAKLRPILASAFYVSNVPYRWGKGVVERLEAA
jgi:hypothetical protein